MSVDKLLGAWRLPSFATIFGQDHGVHLGWLGTSNLVSRLSRSLPELRPSGNLAELPGTNSSTRSQTAAARQQHEDWDKYEDEDQDDDLEQAAPGNEDWRSMLQDITRYNPDRYAQQSTRGRLCNAMYVKTCCMDLTRFPFCFCGI